MDINFYSGTFYGIDDSTLTNVLSIIASLLGAIISGVIAIYIFRKGIDLQRKEFILAQKDQHLEQESLLNSSCEFLIRAINEQIAKIVEHRKNLKDQNSKNIKLNIETSLTTENIKILSARELFSLIVSSKKGNHNQKVSDYINFDNSIRHIETYIDSFKNYNEEIFRNLDEKRKELNQSMETLNLLHNKVVLDAQQGHKNKISQFLKYFSDRYHSYKPYLESIGQPENLSVLNDILIKDTLNFVNQEKPQMDSDSLEIVSILLKIKKTISEINLEKMNRRRLILNIARSMLSAKRLLIKSWISSNERAFTYRMN